MLISHTRLCIASSEDFPLDKDDNNKGDARVFEEVILEAMEEVIEAVLEEVAIAEALEEVAIAEALEEVAIEAEWEEAVAEGFEGAAVK